MCRKLVAMLIIALVAVPAFSAYQGAGAQYYSEQGAYGRGMQNHLTITATGNLLTQGCHGCCSWNQTLLNGVGGLQAETQYGRGGHRQQGQESGGMVQAEQTISRHGPDTQTSSLALEAGQGQVQTGKNTNQSQDNLAVGANYLTQGDCRCSQTSLGLGVIYQTQDQSQSISGCRWKNAGGSQSQYAQLSSGSMQTH